MIRNTNLINQHINLHFVHCTCPLCKEAASVLISVGCYTRVHKLRILGLMEVSFNIQGCPYRGVPLVRVPSEVCATIDSSSWMVAGRPLFLSSEVLVLREFSSSAAVDPAPWPRPPLSREQNQRRRGKGEGGRRRGRGDWCL